jgi:hypothetical protein
MEDSLKVIEMSYLKLCRLLWISCGIQCLPWDLFVEKNSELNFWYVFERFKLWHVPELRSNQRGHKSPHPYEQMDRNSVAVESPNINKPRSFHRN